VKSEIRHRNVTLVSTNISIKTVIPLVKTNCVQSSASGATDEKSIKIREYKLPALMQLLYSNGRKPVKCRAEKTKYRRKSYMAMIKSKRLTSKRGITLPKDFCEYVGLQPGEAVDLMVDDQTGDVHIRKHVPVCRFCGNRTEAVKYNGIDICPECAAVMAKAVTK
jgi:transcriptional pleiotropic regulator of transition state genes